MLALTTGLPERSLAAGEVVYREGDAVTTVLVLVDGQLEIERGGLVVNSHRVPGSVVGELGALLHQPRSATVTAAVPSVVREIGDPDEFFAAHPQVGLEVARQLAGRLTGSPPTSPMCRSSSPTAAIISVCSRSF